jgi:hypothetical protein
VRSLFSGHIIGGVYRNAAASREQAERRAKRGRSAKVSRALTTPIRVAGYRRSPEAGSEIFQAAEKKALLFGQNRAELTLELDHFEAIYCPKGKMNVNEVLASLRLEREQIKEAVLSLERLAAISRPRLRRPPTWLAAATGLTRPGRRKRKTSSPKPQQYRRNPDKDSADEGIAGVPSALPPRLPQLPSMALKLPLPE